MEEEVKSKVKDLENRLGRVESKMEQILPPAAATLVLPPAVVEGLPQGSPLAYYGKNQQVSQFQNNLEVCMPHEPYSLHTLYSSSFR